MEGPATYIIGKVQLLKLFVWKFPKLCFKLGLVLHLFQQLYFYFLVAKTSTNIYCSDTFDENTPPVDDPEYISSLAAAIFRGMESGDGNAVWLMQVKRKTSLSFSYLYWGCKKYWWKSPWCLWACSEYLLVLCKCMLMCNFVLAIWIELSGSSHMYLVSLYFSLVLVCCLTGSSAF